MREYTVELLVADMETIVMALEPLGLVEIERRCVIDIDRGEVTGLVLPCHAQNTGQSLRRGSGTARGNNDVI